MTSADGTNVDLKLVQRTLTFYLDLRNKMIKVLNFGRILSVYNIIIIKETVLLRVMLVIGDEAK